MRIEKYWPPKGWQTFAHLKKRKSQSILKDPDSARVVGLNYKIISDPLTVMGRSYYTHRITFTAWEYSIRSDSNEIPFLSVCLMDRFDDQIAEEYFISEVKSYSCHVPLFERSARRTIQLSKFLIGQIDKGHVPNYDKLLRMYRLHPNNLTVEREVKRSLSPIGMYVIGSDDKDKASH